MILAAIAIMIAAGLMGGYAAYLTAAVPEEMGVAPTKPLLRYLILGVIAAACVPLFLNLAQSRLLDSVATGLDAKENVPFQDYLVFTGLCLIAAYLGQRFLDSMSEQVMRQVREAKKTAGQAIAQSAAALDKSEVAVELIEDQQKEETDAPITPAVPHAGQVSPQSLSNSALAVLKSLMNVTFRTASGIAKEIGISRMQIGDVLDELASQQLVERTVSPNTGGPRWRITSAGVETIELAHASA